MSWFEDIKHISLVQHDFEQLKRDKFLRIPHYYICLENVRLKTGDSCLVRGKFPLYDGEVMATVVEEIGNEIMLERW